MSSVQRPLNLSDRILGLRHAFERSGLGVILKGSPQAQTRPSDSVPPGNDSEHKLRRQAAGSCALAPSSGSRNSYPPLLCPSHHRPLETLSMAISRMIDQNPCPCARGTGNLRSGHPSRGPFWREQQPDKSLWHSGCNGEQKRPERWHSQSRLD